MTAVIMTRTGVNERGRGMNSRSIQNVHLVNICFKMVAFDNPHYRPQGVLNAALVACSITECGILVMLPH